MLELWLATKNLGCATRMNKTRIYEKIEDAIFRSINANEAYKKIERILKENIKCVEKVNIIITANNKASPDASKEEQFNNEPKTIKNNALSANTKKLTFPISDSKRRYAVIEIFVSDTKEAEKELNDKFMKNLLDLLLYTYKRFHI